MWEFFTPERLVKKLNPNFVDYLKQEIERQYLIKNKKINSSEKNEKVIDEFGRISLRYNQGGELLIAPNGKPSNLTPEQYELVRTPAFKNWFGDWENNPKEASKVVDENGEPLVVYHGSPVGETTEFSMYQQGKQSSGFREYGMYFTTNENSARIYQNEKREQTQEYKDLLKDIEEKNIRYATIMIMKN